MREKTNLFIQPKLDLDVQGRLVTDSLQHDGLTYGKLEYRTKIVPFRYEFSNLKKMLLQ